MGWLFCGIDETAFVNKPKGKFENTEDPVRFAGSKLFLRKLLGGMQLESNIVL